MESEVLFEFSYWTFRLDLGGLFACILKLLVPEVTLYKRCSTVLKSKILLWLWAFLPWNMHILRDSPHQGFTVASERHARLSRLYSSCWVQLAFLRANASYILSWLRHWYCSKGSEIAKYLLEFKMSCMLFPVYELWAPIPHSLITKLIATSTYTVVSRGPCYPRHGEDLWFNPCFGSVFF